MIHFSWRTISSTHGKHSGPDNDPTSHPVQDPRLPRLLFWHLHVLLDVGHVLWPWMDLRPGTNPKVGVRSSQIHGKGITAPLIEIACRSCAFWPRMDLCPGLNTEVRVRPSQTHAFPRMLCIQEGKFRNCRKREEIKEFRAALTFLSVVSQKFLHPLRFINYLRIAIFMMQFRFFRTESSFFYLQL